MLSTQMSALEKNQRASQKDGQKTLILDGSLLRSGLTLLVLFAFLHGQLSANSVRLVPGELLPSPHQQPATPPPPGQVQQPPTTPAPEQETTVVQVPVPKDNTLDISVIEGEGASNIVGKKGSVKPLIEVRDEKNQLLEGAVVTFIAPADGPSFIFSNALRTVTVMTDAQGRARTPAFRAVNSGPFRLQVTASFRGQMVSTSISETNFDSAAEARGQASSSSPANPDHPVANKKGGGGLSATTWLIIIGACAGAAVGIGVGLGHKGSTTAATTTSASVGTPGSPTVGAP